MKRTSMVLAIALTAMLVLISCGSSSSDSAPITTTATGPSAPQSVSVQSKVQKTTVSWDAVTDATSYNLYWSQTSPVSTSSSNKVAGVTSPYQHTHLNAGNYYYAVTAVNANGESSISSEATGTINLISFVTSSSGNANLSSWPDAVSAGSATGLAAGDAICQARANAANLTGTFKAWLSSGGTNTTDAYCRIHGMTGTKADNCGQAVLPAFAGPWIRTDGIPFAPTIDKLVATTHVYSPLLYDEFGNRTFGSFIFTNTLSDGTNDDSKSACEGWTDGSTALANELSGLSYFAIAMWTSGYSLNCTDTANIYCMQTGAGQPLANFPATGKIAFVTSVTGSANLGSWPDAVSAGSVTGIAAGDAICKARASAAGLLNPTHFKVWLSDSSTDAITRLTSNGPWIRKDGVKIADSKADLVNDHILAQLHVTETGLYAQAVAWTGTYDDGTKDTANVCLDWTDNTTANFGAGGGSWAGNWAWTHYSLAQCSYPQRLYCFED